MPASSRAGVSRADRTRSCAARCASLRRIQSRLGIVTLLDRSGVGRQQRLEAIEVELRRLDFGIDRGGIGLRRVDLGARLTDVLGARPCLEQAQLRQGRGTVGARPRDLQRDVLGIEARDDRAGLDAIALGDAQLQEPATDFGRGVNLGRLDMTGDTDSIGGWCVRARRHPCGQDEHQQTMSRRESRHLSTPGCSGSHGVFRSMPRAEACIWRTN